MLSPYEVFLCAVLAVFGAAFGSFAGATVWRLRHKRDMVRERSECEQCHHQLAVFDLIPLVSWLALKGKCRYCKEPIGKEALLIELGLATFFVVSYLSWPVPLMSGLQWLDFGLWLALGVGLAILFVYDLKWYLLPDRVMAPLVAIAALDFGLYGYTAGWSLQTFAVELVLALLAVTGFYGFIYAVSKGEWVGFGDVKLGIVMGLTLGWQAALLAVLLANLIGTLIILPGLASGKLSRRTRVPFGPFLIAGLVVAGLYGTRLIEWYTGLLTIGL